MVSYISIHRFIATAVHDSHIRLSFYSCSSRQRCHLTAITVTLFVILFCHEETIAPLSFQLSVKDAVLKGSASMGNMGIRAARSCHERTAGCIEWTRLESFFFDPSDIVDKYMPNPFI